MSSAHPPRDAFGHSGPLESTFLPPPSARRFARSAHPATASRGESVASGDGLHLWLRPIKPTDVTALQRCFLRLSEDEVRMRFLYPMYKLPDAMARQLCTIDPERELALALVDREAVPEEIRGVGRLYFDRTLNQAEFSVLVERTLTGRGLGALLMQRLVDTCRERGVARLWGHVLIENRPMLDLCRSLGFTRQSLPGEPGTAVIALDLA